MPQPGWFVESLCYGRSLWRRRPGLCEQGRNQLRSLILVHLQ